MKTLTIGMLAMLALPACDDGREAAALEQGRARIYHEAVAGRETAERRAAAAELLVAEHEARIDQLETQLRLAEDARDFSARLLDRSNAAKLREAERNLRMVSGETAAE